MSDAFDLERFVSAQDAAGIYHSALAEISCGRKSRHWMWFVFPQLAGLGHSAMAQRYAISGLDEAHAYLAHPILGHRLVECAAALVTGSQRSAVEILGAVDAQKLRSSMTLFSLAAPNEPLFARVLDIYFGGEADPATTRRLTVH